MSGATRLVQPPPSIGLAVRRGRRASGFGFRVWTRVFTRCGSAKGENVASKNPGGVQLENNSITQVGVDSASQSVLRQTPASRCNDTEGLVFGLGSSESMAWDAVEVGSPLVRRYIGDDEERWYMWYHGGLCTTDSSIGLATSSNGICWARGEGGACSSRDVGKVLSSRSDWWAFDTAGVRPSDMVIMSSPMYSGVYWLYYTGYTNEELCQLRDGITAYKALPGLACSQDGRNWARIEGDHHNGALLDVGAGTEWDSLYIDSPKIVVHADNDFRMYYHSYDVANGEFAVGLARSRDGIRWVKLGKVMGASNRKGAFDELGLASVHVVRENNKGRYVMVYEGVSSGGRRRSIGVAASDDGLTNWTRIRDRPILEPREGDGWDDMAVSSPCLVRVEAGEWRLYYKGVGRCGTAGIGVAVSTAVDFSQFRRWQRFHM